jgi:hypothetical protein
MFNWDKLLSPKPSLDVPALETVDLNDKEMEKRIVRKQDLRIMPWVCITYLLSTHPRQQKRMPSNAIRLPRPSQPRKRTHSQQ